MARIFVIHSDGTLRRMLQAHLERLGHQVVIATNLRSALARFAERPPDVILTDRSNPDETWPTMMQAQMWREGRPRIIAVAQADVAAADPHLSHAMRFGLARVLPPPFSKQELVAAIDSMMSAAPRTAVPGR